MDAHGIGGSELWMVRAELGFGSVGMIAVARYGIVVLCSDAFHWSSRRSPRVDLR